MHRDLILMSLPSTHILGSTDVTANQGMVIFNPTLALDLDLDMSRLSVPLTSIHMLTVQGHPEFTKWIMSKVLNAHIGILGEGLVKEAHLRAGGISRRYYLDGLASDGVGKVGKVI